MKVIKALIKRFGGSVSVQAERTKMGRMFQSEWEFISAWECRVVERARYCEYGNFEDQACRDRFIAGLVDETLQEKLNTNGQRKKKHLTQYVTLKNRVSWKRLLSRLHGSPTASIKRNPTEAFVCVLILAKRSIKPLKSQSNPLLQLYPSSLEEIKAET